jgi:hypothetical protein
MNRGGAKVALIWGAIGILLAFQADRLLSYAVHSTSKAPLAETLTPPAVSAAQASTPDAPGAASPVYPDIPLSKTEEGNSNAFNRDRFTQSPSPTSVDSVSSVISPSPISLPSGSLPPTSAPAPSGLAQLSPYPSFNSQQLDEKIALYHQEWEMSGPPDVLIIGSSRALRGVDPAALRQDLAKLGYTNLSVFNYGINGATAQVVDLVIRRIFTAEQLPRLIIWADGARAFNSGNVDVTYNGIAVSEGYRELLAGTLPQPTSSSQPTDAAAAPQTGLGGLGTSLSSSYQNLDHWLSDRLGTVSTVHAERDRLKALLQGGLTTLLPHLSNSQSAWNAANPDGNAPSLTETQGMIDINGFLPISIRFNPATYYQKYARVQGQFDSDYEDFRIEGKQADALKSLLAFTRSHHIPVVFVNLPMTDDYLDPARLQYEQQFRQYMINLTVGQEGFIFRDLSDLWPSQYDYFSDPSHLNRYGAVEVSARLAQDPIIPWAKATHSESASNTEFSE